MDQMALFNADQFVDTNKKPENGTCAECQHIIAIKFDRKILLFCQAQKGGRYGKKIKKYQAACGMKKEADTPFIEVYGGYYGEKCKPANRGRNERKDAE